MERAKTLLELVQNSVAAWGKVGGARLAAALAFFTILSLSPTLIIVVGAAGFFVGQESVQTEITSRVEEIVGADAAGIISSMIASNTAGGATVIATLIGIGLLIFGASNLFVQLYETLNIIFQVAPYPDRSGVINFAYKRLIAVVIILVLIVVMIATLVANTLIAAFGEQIAAQLPGGHLLTRLLNAGLVLIVLIVVFATLFRYVPAITARWWDILPGAGVTATLFFIGESLISLYLSRSSLASVYGAAGSVVVLLLWVYYSAQIILIGAVFTRIYAEQFGEGIQAGENAVKRQIQVGEM